MHLIILLIIIYFGVYGTLLGQETTDIEKNNVIDKTESLSFGFNTTIGDATLMQIIPSLQFTYYHRFSNIWAAELSYAYTGQAIITTSSTAGQFAFIDTQIGKASIADLSGYYTSTSEPLWSFGAGLSMRHRMYAGYLAQYPFLDNTRIKYLLDYSLGIHLTTEYLLVKFEPAALSLRGRIGYFFPAFVGDAIIDDYSFKNFPGNPDAKWPVPPNYNTYYTVPQYFRNAIATEPFIVSLGAFLRISF